MRPVSAEFLNILRGSHDMDARVRVVASFQTGVDPIGTPITLNDGEVVHDANADVRARVRLTTTDKWLSGPFDLITPYGNELYVERAVVRGGGTKEWVSQGYFRIHEIQQDNAPDGEISIIGLDRMSGLIASRLVAPAEFPAGTSIATIFSVLVEEVYPLAEILFDFPAATTFLETTQIAEQDRYAFLLDIARSRGKVMFFDHAGRLRVESPPEPDVPLWEVNAGRDGVLISMARSLSREGVYNAVVALGETMGEQPPVRAVARDDNPNSPTWWDGAYGKVPRFYSSPFITSGEQALSAAISLLRRNLGVPYNVDFQAIANPALEPLDPIRITHTRDSELHIVERLAIPLVAERSMTGATRQRPFIQIGVGD